MPPSPRPPVRGRARHLDRRSTSPAGRRLAVSSTSTAGALERLASSTRRRASFRSAHRTLASRRSVDGAVPASSAAPTGRSSLPRAQARGATAPTPRVTRHRARIPARHPSSVRRAQARPHRRRRQWEDPARRQARARLARTRLFHRRARVRIRRARTIHRIPSPAARAQARSPARVVERSRAAVDRSRREAARRPRPSIPNRRRCCCSVLESAA